MDCGFALNPNVIRAQIEGAVGYGFGSVLFNAVNLGKGGVVQDQNFDIYRMLRINEMPTVEVEIITSDADPSGIGEPVTPPIGPTVANAWRALTRRTSPPFPFRPRPERNANQHPNETDHGRPNLGGPSPCQNRQRAAHRR